MKKGISLVALVITIIVLIILAGAVIFTMMDDSIFERAQQAVKDRNEAEVYSAVQREVLNMQTEYYTLDIGPEFAKELQGRLIERYPTSNATANYISDNEEIEIGYNLNKEPYSLVLTKEFKLTMMDENEKNKKSLDKERVELQGVFTQHFPEGVESLEELEAKLPEGWNLEDELFLDGYAIVKSKEGNIFYVTGEGVGIEKVGADDPIWLSLDGSVYYLGNEETIVIDDNYTINNLYEYVYNDSGISSIQKSSDSIKGSDINSIYFRYSKVEEITLSINKDIDYSFSGAPNLTTVTITSPITYVEGFSDCPKLTTVSLPNTVLRIDKNAFNDCESLKDITIPASITKIDSGAFSGCPLEHVYVPTEAIRQEAIDSGISASVIVNLY